MKFIQTLTLTLLCACLVYFGFIYISQIDQVKKTASLHEAAKENETALAAEETRSTKKTETTHSSL